MGRAAALVYFMPMSVTTFSPAHGIGFIGPTQASLRGFYRALCLDTRPFDYCASEQVNFALSGKHSCALRQARFPESAY